MKIGFAQFGVTFGDRNGNLAQMETLALAAPGAQLLVFPELATSGYNFATGDEVAELAETFGDGPTSSFLRELSARTGCVLVAGYPEVASGRFYNSCMMATPAGALHNYRKIHLFSRENDFFSPGDAPPPVVETEAGRIGMMICFDWFFPETARILALARADIIAHPSNLVLPYCQRAMFARSVENGVFSVTANRTGTEDRAGHSLTFTGQSQVVSPKGDVLVSVGPEDYGVGVADIDFEMARNKRLNAHNDLVESRRPELYDSLCGVTN